MFPISERSKEAMFLSPLSGLPYTPPYEKLNLGWKPHPWQRESIQKIKRATVIGAHRQAGKTELALRYCIEKALCTKNNAIGYFAPNDALIDLIAYPRLQSILEPLYIAGGVDFTDAMNRYPKAPRAALFKNGSEIYLFGFVNEEILRNHKFYDVVIDEADLIASKTWYDLIKPTLYKSISNALFIGTPNGKRLLYALYNQAEIRGANWRALKYTALDTGLVDPEELNSLKKDLPPDRFNREYMCNLD